MQAENTHQEMTLILSRYRDIQQKLRSRTSIEQRKRVRNAFLLAAKAHKDMKRRSGEPYILHPLEVANIVLDNMNLGATSVICALLHDTVEDTDYTLEDMEQLFGKEVATLIDGLTKIDNVPDTQASRQFETFRKILISMSKDPRVILIKLADRLHNMRTLDAMPTEKQMKIASETLYMYAPLAHRLGFYKIKSELEDLCMKYQDPGSYRFIENKIKESAPERNAFIENFIRPIREELEKKGEPFEIISRVKSIYSIWQKMIKKSINFEEVYDLFAIRIIVDTDFKNQKSACWSVYSTITDIYKPGKDRLRDWIATPKSNGYQALHVTVMSKEGKWVEVQIRSRQMDAIAENGFAAHWIYKEDGKVNQEQGVEIWLAKVREILQKDQKDTGELMSKVKMNLFNKEIFVFTPKGDEYTMPEKSVVLDFAFEINNDLGLSCIGAKVNNKLVPPSHQLESGDQIEIITSKKQKVHEEWLGIVVTSKAREQILEALEIERKKKTTEGKQKLKSLFEKYNIEISKLNREKLMVFVDYKTKEELYLGVYNGSVSETKIKQCFSKMGIFYRLFNFFKPVINRISEIKNIFSVDMVLQRKLARNPRSLLLEKDIKDIKQTIATCCNPVAGDKVIGFISNNEIIVHRTNCPIAIQLSSRKGEKIVKTKWRQDEAKIEFLTGIFIEGIDDRGLVNNITGIISKDFHVNCRSIHFETIEYLFKGKIMLYIQDVEHLNKLIDQLRLLEGIKKVERIYSDRDETIVQ